MSHDRERFLVLFDQLSPVQQADMLKIMENWATRTKAPDSEVPIVPVSPLLQHPQLSKEWHCLSALKQVVDKHYSPHIELAYVAFHPDLDSVSTAKTREAASRMYQLEASYELKAIFEQQPELLDSEVLDTLDRSLQCDKEE